MDTASRPQILQTGQRMRIINPYRYGGAGLLLDLFSGAAAAYSLRHLRTAYTGAAIRVRRGSDNAEQDIGFDGSGDLDTSTLLSFVGVGGTGVVPTFYDQSGNGRHWSQATGVAQPFIVTTGSVEVDGNGNTAIRSDSNRLVTLAVAMPTATGEVFAVIDTTDSDWALLGDGSNRNLPIAQFGSTNTETSRGVGTPGFRKNGAAASPTTRGQVHALYDGAVSLVGFTTVDLGGISSLFEGGASTTLRFQGRLPEIVLYPDEQSANRAGIEANIATYYGITFA